VFDLSVPLQVFLLCYTLLAPSKVTLVASLLVYTLSVLATRLGMLVGPGAFVTTVCPLRALTTVVVTPLACNCKDFRNLTHLSESLPVEGIRDEVAVSGMTDGETERFGDVLSEDEVHFQGEPSKH